jgi:hypothetical protein
MFKLITVAVLSAIGTGSIAAGIASVLGLGLLAGVITGAILAGVVGYFFIGPVLNLAFTGLTFNHITGAGSSSKVS